MYSTLRFVTNRTEYSSAHDNDKIAIDLNDYFGAICPLQELASIYSEFRFLYDESVNKIEGVVAAHVTLLNNLVLEIRCHTASQISSQMRIQNEISISMLYAYNIQRTFFRDKPYGAHGTHLDPVTMTFTFLLMITKVDFGTTNYAVVVAPVLS